MLLKQARYIPFSYYSPYENMAIDEYLISYYKAVRIPVLRIYGWRPAGITIGRYQDAKKDINLDECLKDKIPVIRRITGGGAIFHGMEITYCLVCSQKDINKNEATVKQNYKVLNAVLIKMYEKFGLKADFAVDLKQGPNRALRMPFCFSGNEEYDIIINGKKMGGNAQKRIKDIIFQHGSIPLTFDKTTDKYFKSDIDNKKFLCLSEAAGVEIKYDAAAANMIAAFMETFDMDIKEEKLNMNEKKEIVKLAIKKYSNQGWNLKGEDFKEA